MTPRIPEGTVIKARAPIRLDFAGGFTDVPPYSAREGGAVVNAAINRYTYTTLVPRADGALKMFSADFDLFVEVKSFRDIEYDGNLDMVKAAINTLGIEQGMDLYVRCDAPPGSGTGSSASIGVALIGLLNHLQDRKLSPHEIAQLARRLEFQELKIAGGKQDQYAAAVGGVNFIEFLDPTVSSSRLDVPREVILDLEKHLVLCYTGKSRLSGNLIENVMGNYEKGEITTTRALGRLKEIAHEVKTALLVGDTPRLGALLAENWECQKRLDGSITNDQIEHLFKVAMGAGAIGGKALGAGGGGCLLFMADSNREHSLRRALEGEGVQIIDFNFDTQGLQTWSVPKS
ncbi:GHMP kinase [Candidatus Sumerlaeota bacterium]|nr:GHMP kinase [Candidatus Sumerlaeota bacterium]